MVNVKELIKAVEEQLEELAGGGVMLDLNIVELEDIISYPQNYLIKPSEMCDSWLTFIGYIKDDIIKLYNLLDKLFDVLYLMEE